MIKDIKGHFVKPGFTLCGRCLKDDWKNYWIDLRGRNLRINLHGEAKVGRTALAGTPEEAQILSDLRN